PLRQVAGVREQLDHVVAGPAGQALERELQRVRAGAAEPGADDAQAAHRGTREVKGWSRCVNARGAWTMPEQVLESTRPAQAPLSRSIAHIESVPIPTRSPNRRRRAASRRSGTSVSA